MMEQTTDSSHLTEFRATILRIWAWSFEHKFKAAVSLFFFLLAVQYLMLPNNSLLSLRKENPHRTALMQQRVDETALERVTPVPVQKWIPISKISPHLIHAVIVAEDGTFYEHGGVDWYELEESIEKNIEKGTTARGGSTISQQLAKNLYLSTSKNPLRKLKELVITLRMERMLPKKRILELYLNVIEWGPNIYGAEAASRKYFDKPASALTREEAARMAAVIPSPRRHQPNQDSKYVKRRSSVILTRMAMRGF